MERFSQAPGNRIFMCAVVLIVGVEGNPNPTGNVRAAIQARRAGW